MEKNCKTCKHGISMDKVCKNCKHGNWGAEFPKVCLSCKEGEFWEPKEAMDIWKEAPEGAEYYQEFANSFFKFDGLQALIYSENKKQWVYSGADRNWIFDQIGLGLMIKRPQAEQEETKEWKDGLPPVGYTQLQIEKPIGWHDGDFKVVAHVDGLIDEDGAEYEIAILCSNNGVVKSFLADELKPIQSQAEKEREEFVKSFCDYSWEKFGSYEKDKAEAIYEWLIESGMAKRLADKADS